MLPSNRIRRRHDSRKCKHSQSAETRPPRIQDASPLAAHHQSSARVESERAHKNVNMRRRELCVTCWRCTVDCPSAPIIDEDDLLHGKRVEVVSRVGENPTLLGKIRGVLTKNEIKEVVVAMQIAV